MVELEPTVERLQRNRNARTAALAIAMLAGALVLGDGAGAQVGSPVGVWRTVDDESGQAKALVRITEAEGRLSGRIEKLFSPSRADPVCEHCTDERQDQPIVGMTILKGLKAADAGWEDGEILDPSNGKTYRAKAPAVGRRQQTGGARIRRGGAVRPHPDLDSRTVTGNARHAARCGSRRQRTSNGDRK